MANEKMKAAVPLQIKTEVDFSGLVEALCAPGGTVGARKRWQNQALPSRQVIGKVVESLRAVLFPGYFGFFDHGQESIRFHVGSALDHIRIDLQEQIKRGLCFTCEEGPGCVAFCDQRAKELTGEFLRSLPGVQRTLATDVRAAF
jgi:serine O-acetyltransferase